MMIRPKSIDNAISLNIGYLPPELTAAVLLRNGQVEEKVVLDDSAKAFLNDLLAGMKLQETTSACRDFMRDNYGGEHTIGMQLPPMGWVLAAALDDYTLVAMAKPGSYPPMVEWWLKRLGKILTSPTYSA